MYHLRLTWNYMKQKKSRTICSIMGILLTIILSFSVLTAGYSFLDYALEITYLNNGHTQLFTTDAVTKEQFTQICNYANVEHVLLYDQNGNQCTEISANSKDEVFDMFIGLKDTSDLYKSAEQLSAHTGLSIFADETIALYLMQGEGISAYFFRSLLLIVASIFAIFSVLVIRNTMMISVVERMKDYGLFRCVGMSKKQLYQLLITEGLCMDAFGLAGGITLGYGILKLVEPILNKKLALPLALHFQIYSEAVLYTALLCIAVTLFSLVEPCRQAGLLSPVEAIKNQMTFQQKGKRKQYKGTIWKLLFGVEGEYAYKSRKLNNRNLGYIGSGVFLCIVLSGIIFSFCDSTTATYHNLYEGKQVQYTDEIKVYGPYDQALIEEIKNDLSREFKITETGLLMEKFHISPFDQTLANKELMYCWETGYDKEQIEQLKDYVIEGEISYEKLEKEKGIILCDTIHNVTNEIGLQVDKRVTDYQVGDTISFLSQEGLLETTTLFYETIKEAITLLQLPIDTTDNMALLIYNQKQEHFDELLETTLLLLKEKGYDCQAFQPKATFSSMYYLNQLLQKMAYENGKKDIFVVQAIISNDIFNGGRYMPEQERALCIIHPSSFVFSNLIASETLYASEARYYDFAVTFNYGLEREISNIGAYFEKKCTKGVTFEYMYTDNSIEQIKKTVDSIELILWFFTIFISLICFIQISNTMLAGIALRKQEFQTLSMVGMTKKQEQKIYFLEQLVILFSTIVAGILVSYAFAWYIVDYLLNQDGSICFAYSFDKVLGISFSMLLVTWIISKIGTRTTRD